MKDDSLVKIEIGERLRNLRVRSGYSLHQVSFRYLRLIGGDVERQNVTGYIGRVEKGAILPKRNRLVALAEAEGASAVERDEILMLAGYVPEHELILSDPIEAIDCCLRATGKFSDDDIRQIKDYVAFIMAKNPPGE